MTNARRVLVDSRMRISSIVVSDRTRTLPHANLIAPTPQHRPTFPNRYWRGTVVFAVLTPLSLATLVISRPMNTWLR